MPPARLDAYLGAVFSSVRPDSRPDAELLARFLDDRDEVAFAALLARHTPAVRAACRGWLRAAADIDDAAQATFLVLVQRAGSIRDRAALGGWLYRVADNVARRLRRRLTNARPLPGDVPARPPAADHDLRDVLAEEVARLPEKYRLPVQLCYWAGLTTAEAARRLGWPRGTVLTRLAWARRRLQKGLARRGQAPALLAGLVATAPGLSAAWARETVRAAKGLRAGEPLAKVGVSERTASVTEGVVRAMMWARLKYVVVAALVAAGLTGFGVRYLASAPDDSGSRSRPALDAPAGKDAAKADAAKADEPRPAAPGRRREAVIRVPAGTFVKEVNAAPYGHGRLTLTYEDERVLTLVEGSVMGVEFELTTEAEFSLSSNGTIYGLVTSARINHLRLPNNKEFAEIQAYIGMWSIFEPLFNEVMTDLPFSYQFRLQGDRLILTNFRMLLAGPNPLGKLGGLVGSQAGGHQEAMVALTAFQALGTALEGTYTVSDAKERPAPDRPRMFPKPGRPGGEKPTR